MEKYYQHILVNLLLIFQLIDFSQFCKRDQAFLHLVIRDLLLILFIPLNFQKILFFLQLFQILQCRGIL